MFAFKQYWKLYGGTRSLLRSPYIYSALALTILCYPFWSLVDGGHAPWAQSAVEIIPSLLGFSMGGMAIMLAFSNSRSFRIIAEEGEPTSLFAKVIASFFHFVLIQSLALCAALIVKGYPAILLSFAGFFLMSYAIMVAVATAGQLLNVSVILNATASLPEHKPVKPKNKQIRHSAPRDVDQGS